MVRSKRKLSTDGFCVTEQIYSPAVFEHHFVHSADQRNSCAVFYVAEQKLHYNQTSVYRRGGPTSKPSNPALERPRIDFTVRIVELS